MPRLTALACIYTLAIAFLLVSTLPVLSGKKIGTRVAPNMVLPVFLVVVLFVALLVSYPWYVLTVGSLAFITSLPLGWMSYRRYMRKDAEAAAAKGTQAAAHSHVEAPPPAHPGVAQSDEEDRPSRLN